MVRRLLLGSLVLLAVASCGRLAESRLNPFNWFGRDREAEGLTPVTVETRRDTRPLVELVVSVRMDRAPGGAILHAVGLPPVQGYWDSELVLDAGRSSASRLIYQFRIRPPLRPVRVSTPRSREVTAALFLSEQTLAGIGEVQVLGAGNARAVGR